MISPAFRLLLALVFALVLPACFPNINLFTDPADPLEERVISGKGDEKVLLLQLHGTISDLPEEGLITQKPSMVQELVSQLNMARQDSKVKAVVLCVNSPGGTVTASDILFHELLRFKEETKAKMVVCMMDLAASGGYYVSLPADWIMAHPTTITGSVGVILLRPEIAGLMKKIGVSVDTSTSGKNKDMGSPFRPQTGEEERLFQEITDSMAQRFTGLVRKYRPGTHDHMDVIGSARIFTALQALDNGLVDEIGYLDQAIKKAMSMAELPEDSKVVAYRRTEYPDDNIYNPATMGGPFKPPALVDMGPVQSLARLSAGFYYLWMPGQGF